MRCAFLAHLGPLTLGLKNPQNPSKPVFYPMFLLYENAKKIKPPVESPMSKSHGVDFLHTSHKKLTPNTNLASSVVDF